MKIINMSNKTWSWFIDYPVQTQFIFFNVLAGREPGISIVFYTSDGSPFQSDMNAKMLQNCVDAFLEDGIFVKKKNKLEAKAKSLRLEISADNQEEVSLASANTAADLARRLKRVDDKSLCLNTHLIENCFTKTQVEKLLASIKKAIVHAYEDSEANTDEEELVTFALCCLAETRAFNKTKNNYAHLPEAKHGNKAKQK